MSTGSRLPRLSFARIIVFAAAACAALSSAAMGSDAGSTFYNSTYHYMSTQEIFGLEPVQMPEEPDSIRFTVTPPNYNVAANSTGNTFVWTFTGNNSAGGNAEDVTFIIPNGFTPPTGHITVTPGTCDASLQNYFSSDNDFFGDPRFSMKNSIIRA